MLVEDDPPIRAWAVPSVFRRASLRHRVQGTLETEAGQHPPQKGGAGPCLDHPGIPAGGHMSMPPGAGMIGPSAICVSPPPHSGHSGQDRVVGRPAAWVSSAMVGIPSLRYPPRRRYPPGRRTEGRRFADQAGEQSGHRGYRQNMVDRVLGNGMGRHPRPLGVRRFLDDGEAATAGDRVQTGGAMVQHAAQNTIPIARGPWATATERNRGSMAAPAAPAPGRHRREGGGPVAPHEYGRAVQAPHRPGERPGASRPAPEAGAACSLPKV